MNILGTGLTGLVGSRITQLLAVQHSFTPISRLTGIDITNFDQVQNAIVSSDASVVLHLAAKTDVDGCELDIEKDKELKSLLKEQQTWEGKDTAWAVNVVGTENIIAACEKTKKHLIYISTDFIFDGDSPSEEGYDEEATGSPVNWYGETKYQAELRVGESTCPWTIIRLAYPYRSSFTKKEFLRVIMDRLKNNLPVQAITDHLMTPTFIDDFAFALDTVVSQHATGIFHGVGSQFLSPHEVATQIAHIYGYDQTLITKTTRAEYFKNKAKRPFKSILKNAKIEKLGIKMHTFEEGLEIVKKQIEG